MESPAGSSLFGPFGHVSKASLWCRPAGEAYLNWLKVYRRLAAANPAAYQPDLASSLNNLSIDLAERAGATRQSVPNWRPSASTKLLRHPYFV